MVSVGAEILARRSGSARSPYVMTEYLTSQDLVDSGLYPTTNAVQLAVRRGVLPARRLGRRLVFIKEEIDAALTAVEPVSPTQPRRYEVDAPRPAAQRSTTTRRPRATSDWRQQLREAAQ